MKKALLLAVLSIPALSMAGLIGYYDFNNTTAPTFAANPNVESLLLASGQTNPLIAGTPVYVTETIGAFTKQVADVPANSGFFANHGIPGNGGGNGVVNTYSLMFDVRTRTNSDEYFSFFQTSANNGNDGDMFARKGSSIGIGISGQYAGGWEDEVWSRVIVTIDHTQAPTNLMKVYRDGVLVNSPSLSASSSVLNGRWSLLSKDDADPANQHMWLFMDEDGESMNYQVSSVAWWDTALDATQVAALGAVGSAISFPVVNNITGTLNLLNTADDGIAGSEDINWTLTDGSTTATGTVAVDDFGGGSFSIAIPAGTPNGTYSLKFKGGTFLASTANVTLTGSSIAVGTISLINGDIDQDTEVGPGDFEAVVAQFGGAGDADLDNDGEVGPSDFEVVIANFGLGDN